MVTIENAKIYYCPSSGVDFIMESYCIDSYNSIRQSGNGIYQTVSHSLSV